MNPPAPTPTLPAAAIVRRPAVARAGWLIAGAGALVVIAIASIALGTRDVSLDEVIGALAGGTDGVGEAAVTKRIPRTVLALLIGAALAMAGTTVQAVTRNPLADLGILGVSMGASFAVVVSIVAVGAADPWLRMAVATVGAGAAAVFVYVVGSLGRGGATPLKLTLAGAATSAALTSLVSAVLLPRVDLFAQFRFWQIGGVGGATWDRIAVVAPVIAIAAVVCFAVARGMNSIALGDDLAAGLGVRVGRTRLVAAIGAVVLCGAATAVAGPIGFVGLVVPHACRLLVGTDHRWLLPMSALVGAGLLTVADIVGRVALRPEEVQVGIVTALIGAPAFIWLVRRQRVREL